MVLRIVNDGMSEKPRPLTLEEMAESRQKDTADSIRRERESELRTRNALSAQTLRDQAEAAGQWIYDPALKKWYTPKEFYEEYKLYFRDHPLFHKVKLRHPNDGIRAGFKQLTDLQARLIDFVSKVTSYYSKS